MNTKKLVYVPQGAGRRKTENPPPYVASLTPLRSVIASRREVGPPPQATTAPVLGSAPLVSHLCVSTISPSRSSTRIGNPSTRSRTKASVLVERKLPPMRISPTAGSWITIFFHVVAVEFGRGLRDRRVVQHDVAMTPSPKRLPPRRRFRD